LSVVSGVASSLSGFGIAAQSTAYVKELDPTANVVLHQCDVGEYLRFEDEMFN
jgi:60S ribosome subunit biogenesis protein NIP7